MILITIVVISAVVVGSAGESVRFPPWFKFGASTAAYQVEGAWNVSDKAESVWDRLSHARAGPPGRGSADDAADSYHLWRRDVQMARELGLHFYKFSMSWSRLLPTGYSNVISEDGRRYYSDLIDGLLAAGIEPVVILHYFDLPQVLQNHGGWVNPLIAEWFGEYARVAFSLFAGRVRTWLTVEEPSYLCDVAYSSGLLAPGVKEPSLAPFLCTKHVLLAHAAAWRIYDTHYKPLYHGRVSIANNVAWLYEASPDSASVTQQALQFTVGRHTHPIFSAEGGWPPGLEDLMREVSAKEGYHSSRLPHLSPEEIQFIRGTYDYFPLSYFTCRAVRRARRRELPSQLFLQGIPELGAVVEDPPGPAGAARFTVVCPAGLRSTLSWIKQQYGDIPILITGNGFSTAGRGLQDDDRIHFIRSHLEQVLLSMERDAVNVTGYSYFALMDGYDWVDGYNVKFGLYEVDFSSPRRERTPRASANYYADVIRTRSLRVDSATHSNSSLNTQTNAS